MKTPSHHIDVACTHLYMRIFGLSRLIGPTGAAFKRVVRAEHFGGLGPSGMGNGRFCLDMFVWDVLIRGVCAFDRRFLGASE